MWSLALLVGCLGTVEADPEFRATRAAVEMPREASSILTDLMTDEARANEVLDHVASVFDIPRAHIGIGSLVVDGYQESEGEYMLQVDLEPGYRYCRSRVYEYYYAGFGAAAMDAAPEGIDVLAYLAEGRLGQPSFFKVELEVLVIREDLLSTPTAEAVCSEPRQPFYQRHWGGCC
ncbi:hypothetical protein [Aquisalimonas sp.]|uniref:hypothetical protein n=1 Tax=Aquisalimonas sp. TaxID=1872621 RepID=UPI0025B8D7D1|nr:hypothetical protein [Aquisalimonas sp.]